MHADIPLSFSTAALGGEIVVPTLNGQVNLKIPVETQTGRLFRLTGKGVKSVRSAAVGDLYCHIIVETPVNLTKRQKELLQELEETMDEGGKRHSPKEHSWSDKGKTFFEGVKGWFDKEKENKS